MKPVVDQVSGRRTGNILLKKKKPQSETVVHKLLRSPSVVVNDGMSVARLPQPAISQRHQVCSLTSATTADNRQPTTAWR